MQFHDSICAVIVSLQWIKFMTYLMIIWLLFNGWFSTCKTTCSIKWLLVFNYMTSSLHWSRTKRPAFWEKNKFLWRKKNKFLWRLIVDPVKFHSGISLQPMTMNQHWDGQYSVIWSPHCMTYHQPIVDKVICIYSKTLTSINPNWYSML